MGRAVLAVALSVLLAFLFVSCGEYSVAFDAQNDTAIVVQSVKKGQVINQPERPELEGHRFEGWYTEAEGGTRWNFTDPLVGELNLYGQWSKLKHVVTFETGAQAIAQMVREVSHGDCVEAYDPPEVSGHAFGGWFLDPSYEKAWDSFAPVTKDFSVYAKWEALKYPLSFHTHETVLASGSHSASTPIEIPEAPEREGYRFIGWTVDPEGAGLRHMPGERIIMSAEPLDLHAQWVLPIVDFDAGGSHSMAVLADGTLLGLGNNSQGQLGDGTRTARSRPVRTASFVLSVFAGGSHTLHIDDSGTLWASGANFEGQLGVGAPPSATQRVKVMEQVVRASAGGSHSLLLTEDGTLWTTGNNEDGQLGDGTTMNRSMPVRVASRVKELSAGSYHSLYLTQEGELWAFGWNEYGQLGDGTRLSRSRPIKIATGVVGISAGANHSLFITEDGSLWAMGLNDEGQLGDGTTEQRTKPVKIAEHIVFASAGTNHSLFIDREGVLWACGSNSHGQSGSDASGPILVPLPTAREVASVSAGHDFSLILDGQGLLVGVGNNEFGQASPWF